VFRRPRVAILPTGDEVVDITATPRHFEVRNSNAYALAVQVRRSGAETVMLPIAKDEYRHTLSLIERGLETDLLLLSGGVSAGKYDIVERILADLGAEFFFDRVKIQPGQPLVFGRVRDRFFFGLPGNPASTMVCYEIFGRSAAELLGGADHPVLPLTYARLTEPFRQKTGLTRFLPATLGCNGETVTPVRWSGSGDVAALARSNCFLVTEPDRESWEAADLIRVLPR
jgi:molybdopterin molybdotransferase